MLVRITTSRARLESSQTEASAIEKTLLQNNTEKAGFLSGWRRVRLSVSLKIWQDLSSALGLWRFGALGQKSSWWLDVERTTLNVVERCHFL